jgi:phosphatidylinositol kinase/protein kinase (PI-3  family)
MNGINAPKVIECFGSDGNKYRQLAKSGNDDLRQDAVCSSLSVLIMSFLRVVFSIKMLTTTKNVLAFLSVVQA